MPGSLLESILNREASIYKNNTQSTFLPFISLLFEVKKFPLLTIPYLTPKNMSPVNEELVRCEASKHSSHCF